MGMAALRSDRLISLRKAKGLSQNKLAQLVGTSQATMNRLEQGETRNPREILAIARALETSADFLLGETDDPGANHEGIPLSLMPSEDDADIVEIAEVDISYGLGGTYVDGPVAAETRQFSRAWLRSFTDAPPELLFWTKGDGDSMEPTIRSGEVILVDRSQNTPRMADGIWALAIGEIGMIKRLHFPAIGRIELLSDNDRVPPMAVAQDELHIVGRVVAVVRKL